MNPQKKIKIAMIEPVGGHGGMDYYDFGLCSSLAYTGADVVLYTCDETVTPQNSGFTVKHSYKGIFGKSPIWIRGIRFLLGTISAVFSAVLEKREICHFHFFHVSFLQVFNIALARLCARKVVITAHDVESFVQSLEVPALSRWVYRQASWIIAHNQVSRNELVNRIGLSPDRISIIPHGNYLHTLQPLPPQSTARKALNIPENAKLILFFGQIKDVKGLDLLLEAMPAVLENHPDALLLIAGKPWKSDFTTYESIISRLGIGKQCITHIRFIPDAEVATYYAAADLLALPYRRIYQSGVVLMAMSYAKAVVVSDLPGMTEVVTDGVDGFVFPSENSSQLAEVLIKALSDDENRECIAKNGLKRMQEHYDWNLIGKKTASVYTQTCYRHRNN